MCTFFMSVDSRSEGSLDDGDSISNSTKRKNSSVTEPQKSGTESNNKAAGSGINTSRPNESGVQSGHGGKGCPGEPVVLGKLGY